MGSHKISTSVDQENRHLKTASVLWTQQRLTAIHHIRNYLVRRSRQGEGLVCSVLPRRLPKGLSNSSASPFLIISGSLVHVLTGTLEGIMRSGRTFAARLPILRTIAFGALAAGNSKSGADTMTPSSCALEGPSSAYLVVRPPPIL